MKVSIIAAVDENRGIGLEDRIPWRLRSDMKRFQKLTTGHHLIMGRKTFESIGKALPNRTTIVLTQNPHFRAEGCLTADSLISALNMAKHRGETEVFICGGETVYDEGLKVAGKLYLTKVHASEVTDTHFPYWYEELAWSQQYSEFTEADADNQYPSTFVILDRKQT